MTICQYPDCTNPLKTGAKFCSRSCAAKAREANKARKMVIEGVPTDPVIKAIANNVDGDTAFVLEEAYKLLQTKIPPVPAPLEHVSMPDIVVSFDGKKDLRPSDRLNYDIIERMLMSGAVTFAVEMKRAPIVRVYDKGRFKVESPDKELAEVAQAALDLILPKMAYDFSWAQMNYGTSFQVKGWEYKSKYELGMSGHGNATTKFLVPKMPKSLRNQTIDHIIRKKDKTRTFDGFSQRVRNTPELLDIRSPHALVMPYQERFGNLWGEPILKSMYPIWLWYEVILRTMSRYMERMAIPVAVGRAPSRGVVETEGKTEPIRALDLVLAVAGNIAKSSAAALPSDRDENGNFLWDLSYLTTTERAQPFLDVLDYLGQELIRAALSADNSLRQSSGGVGSYGIGEVHARASSWTSDMITMLQVLYLNRYFMPDFSLYNRGVGGPPIWLIVQSISMDERAMMQQLLGVSGNSPTSQEFFRTVDWRELADINNIPMLSEEEVEEERERLFKVGLKHQERQQAMMAKHEVNSQLQPKKGQLPNTPGGNDAKKATPPQDTFKQEYNVALEGLFGREMSLPLIVGDVEAETLNITLEFDEAVVVRDATGRFARKAGSAAQKSKPKPLDPDQLDRLNLLELSAEEAARVKDMLAQEIQFESAQDATDKMAEILKEMGLPGLQDVTSVVDDSQVPEGAMGLYNPDTNEFYISSKLAEDIKAGNPAALAAAMHELAHSNQEVTRPLKEREFAAKREKFPDTIFDTQDDTQASRFIRHTEGVNDLVTHMGLSKMYGMPVSPQAISQASYTFSPEFAGHDLDASMGKYGFLGYPRETYYSVVMANAYGVKTGRDKFDWIRNSHNNGLDMGYQRNMIKEVYDAPRGTETKWPKGDQVVSQINRSEVGEGLFESTEPIDEFISEWLADGGKF